MSPKLKNLAAKTLTAEQLQAYMSVTPIYRAKSVVSVHPYTAVARTAALRAVHSPLIRAIRRRKAIIKHFEHRRPETATQQGFRGRLKRSLFEAKKTARSRLTMTPKTRLQSMRHALRLQAGRAFFNYQQAARNKEQAAWNRFMRIHVKAGGKPNITRRNARNMYN